MKRLASVVLLVVGAVGSTQAAEPAGDAAAGQAKAAVCMGCHGMDGNSFNPVWPKLAGQHPDYIATQLQAFQSGTRQDPAMSPMAAPLSAQDVVDLAAYFSTQTRSIEAAQSEQVDLGSKIYRGGLAEKGVSACMACHGPAGTGNPTAGFPSLYGQHTAYIVKALQDFRSGARTTDPQQMMRDVASKMTDAEMQAVAEFVSGLH